MTEIKTVNKAFQVQDGKGKSSYRLRWSFETLAEAEFWYFGIHTHSGYKKRLIDASSGRVIHRCISGKNY